MKKLFKGILIVIYIMFLLSIVKVNSYAYTEEEKQKLRESVAYAMSLIDDNMTEHEKAHILCQYLQEGNEYNLKSMGQNAEDVLVSHKAVCAGYSDACKVLLNTAGLISERVTSVKANHGWNVCYLDGGWCYIDCTQGMTSYECDGGQLFYAEEDFKKYGGNACFEDAIIRTNSFPIPSKTDGSYRSKFLYHSRVYYDENYKYYLKYIADPKAEGLWRAYLCKEDRKTGTQTTLTEDNLVKRCGRDTNIVKEGNYIYYVGKDKKSIYKISTNGTDKKKVLQLNGTEEIGTIVQRDGVIYYVKFSDSSASRNFEYVKLKDFEDWVTTGEYTINNNKQKYNLQYIKTTKGIVIAKCVGINGEEPSGEISIPSSIDGLPVIGIGDEAFYDLKLTGVLNLPANLEYIGRKAFYNNKITAVNFNSKLKSIGTQAFAECSINTEIVLPDSLTYIGLSTFSWCRELPGAKIGKNLIILSDSTFSACSNIKLFEVPEGVQIVGSNALAMSNLKALILPSTLKSIASPFNTSTQKDIEDIWIKSSNMEYMYFRYPSGVKPTIYLPANTETSNLADSKGIEYKDGTNLSFQDTIFTINNTKTGEKNIANLELEVGDNTTILECDISPKFWLNYPITWRSSNENIVRVDNNGKLIAQNAGTATIYAVCNGKEKGINCKVEILNTIELDKNNVEIEIEKKEYITITSDVTNSNVIWKVVSMTNPETEYEITDSRISRYIKVELTENKNQVKVTGVNAEKTNNKYKLIAYVDGRYKGICNITVFIPLETFSMVANNGLSIYASGMNLSNNQRMAIDYQNESHRNFRLNLSYYPENASMLLQNPKVNWIVEDSNIIKHNGNGEFTVRRGGKTNIIAEIGEYRRILEVTVTGDTPIESFKLNEETLKLKPGATANLEGIINPVNTTRDKTISWKSSNPDIATVDSTGKVTAKTNGETIITGTCGEFIASCDVIVQNVFFVEQIKQCGTMFGMLTSAKLDNGEEIFVAWKSNNTAVMPDGSLIGNRGGFATLTGEDETYGVAKLWVYVAEKVELSNGKKQYPGDLNDNKQFDSGDVEILSNIIANNSETDDDLLIADIDGNGTINEKDKELLERIVSEKLFKIPEETVLENLVMGFTNTTVNMEKNDISLMVLTFEKMISLTLYEDVTSEIDASKIEYEVENPTIVEITRNLGTNIEIKALKSGTTKIKATYLDKSCSVTINVKGEPEPDYLLGDINGDGKVNIIDVGLVNDHVKNKKILTGEELKRADIDGNGKVNIIDVGILNDHVKNKKLLW